MFILKVSKLTGKVFIPRFYHLDRVVQQNEFTTSIEDMEHSELNKCLRKFFVSARKQDGSLALYNKPSLASIKVDCTFNSHVNPC